MADPFVYRNPGMQMDGTGLYISHLHSRTEQCNIRKISICHSLSNHAYLWHIFLLYICIAAFVSSDAHLRGCSLVALMAVAHWLVALGVTSERSHAVWQTLSFIYKYLAQDIHLLYISIVCTFILLVIHITVYWYITFDNALWQCFQCMYVHHICIYAWQFRF